MEVKLGDEAQAENRRHRLLWSEDISTSFITPTQIITCRVNVLGIEKLIRGQPYSQRYTLPRGRFKLSNKGEKTLETVSGTRTVYRDVRIPGSKGK